MKNNEINPAYIARCQKQLKEWNAPLDGWYCDDVIDIEEENSSDGLYTCELCGCSRVRFVHVMQHDEYFEEVRVGCVCAGIMEGDVLAARERERIIKNRAKRKRNFPKRKWKTNYFGALELKYKGSLIHILPSTPERKYYIVRCNGQNVWEYKNRLITNFLAAAYAAFDHVDPVERIQNYE